ncbi:ABC transporter ATP-binding protein [Burkholderia anthina]|uniref:ABC transporter ATP-binding protein n=1 Tax=Burkholderia anthina TaxID=179879 RepID=UPI001FB7739C|nr:ABC transporter ATP-binding protein [Burkholderia anthina]
MNQVYKLKASKVRKSYGQVTALEETSLEMKEGEFLTLLGPSGSGKTTLLMAIAGLNPPDSGEIWIDGKLATYLPPFQRDLGMVFQSYALFPHMTIFDNVAFPLRMRKVAENAIRQRVEQVLETVQLPHVAGRLPRELSGGQQQRIALARCFVYGPSIILMDEPLGALDKKMRDALQLEIKHLHENMGTTVLYVTHDQEEAMVMSDRICLMNNARIEQIGTPDEIYFRPRTVFAANFLGESNLLDAVVAESGGNGSGLFLAGGDEIRVATRIDARRGTRMTAIVRPECMRVMADGEHEDNVLSGIVVDSVLTGSVTKLYIELDNGTAVKATQLTTERKQAFDRGQPVRVGWRRDQTVAIPADDAEGV